jgi:hypothetical protein
MDPEIAQLGWKTKAVFWVILDPAWEFLRGWPFDVLAPEFYRVWDKYFICAHYVVIILLLFKLVINEIK